MLRLAKALSCRNLYFSSRQTFSSFMKEELKPPIKPWSFARKLVYFGAFSTLGLFMYVHHKYNIRWKENEKGESIFCFSSDEVDGEILTGKYDKTAIPAFQSEGEILFDRMTFNGDIESVYQGVLRQYYDNKTPRIVLRIKREYGSIFGIIALKNLAILPVILQPYRALRCEGLFLATSPRDIPLPEESDTMASGRFRLNILNFTKLMDESCIDDLTLHCNNITFNGKAQLVTKNSQPSVDQVDPRRGPLILTGVFTERSTGRELYTGALNMNYGVRYPIEIENTFELGKGEGFELEDDGLVGIDEFSDDNGRNFRDN